MSSTQMSTAGPSNSKNQNTFEFTKRKKYADLLITELAEAIILVLSSDYKILFCGTAVTELLGWRDEDLVDGDFNQIINDEDRINFQHGFHDSLITREELTCYVRLKCKTHYSGTPEYDPSPKEVLFELKGHPHFIPDQNDCKCFFAVAKPYPSRNTAMLNTFLELKMENERLQQRLADLRQRAPKVLSASASLLAATYGATTMRPPRSIPAPLAIPNQRASEITQPYYPMSATSAGGYAMLTSPISSTFDGPGVLPYASLYASHQVEDDLSEDGMRKKKMKKAHSTEQHVCVTCGRTDSPEWRKGPQGPKTLCNACGLRWAKQQRKTDDGIEIGCGEPKMGSSSALNTR